MDLCHIPSLKTGPYKHFKYLFHWNSKQLLTGTDSRSMVGVEVVAKTLVVTIICMCMVVHSATIVVIDMCNNNKKSCWE
jgi:hypothetical protein